MLRSRFIILDDLKSTMWNYSLAIFYILIAAYNIEANKRQRRYLLFTKDTQWGVFATVSIPLHPETLVSVAWFFEANYYNVDNATYFETLLGDIEISGRRQRRTSGRITPGRRSFSRRHFYTFIELMLEKQAFPGQPCLLRAICESAASSFGHDGVLGDLLHLLLTPSASIEEDDIEDCYYEAEYWGLERYCYDYYQDCSKNPMDLFSLLIEGHDIVT